MPATVRPVRAQTAETLEWSAKHVFYEMEEGRAGEREETEWLDQVCRPPHTLVSAVVHEFEQVVAFMETEMRGKVRRHPASRVRRAGLGGGLHGHVRLCTCAVQVVATRVIASSPVSASLAVAVCRSTPPWTWSRRWRRRCGSSCA